MYMINSNILLPPPPLFDILKLLILQIYLTYFTSKSIFSTLLLFIMGSRNFLALMEKFIY